MNTLNNNCLRSVFLFVTIGDIKNIIKTSKKFNKIGLQVFKQVVHNRASTTVLKHTYESFDGDTNVTSICNGCKGSTHSSSRPVCVYYCFSCQKTLCNNILEKIYVDENVCLICYRENISQWIEEPRHNTSDPGRCYSS